MQRILLLRRIKQSALADYLRRPFPSFNQSVRKTEFLVLDLETTGLNAKKDHILSLGYTIIRKNRVILSECVYNVIKQKQLLTSDNVSIHQITDSEAEKGVKLKQAFDQLLLNLAGKVLIAHHAEIEQLFLNQACLQLYGSQLPVPVIDTMQIEKRKLERRHAGIKPNQLRLFNIRKSYDLPRYKAHNALEDAVATAELFLVQVANICGRNICRLNDL